MRIGGITHTVIGGDFVRLTVMFNFSFWIVYLLLTLPPDTVHISDMIIRVQHTTLPTVTGSFSGARSIP